MFTVCPKCALTLVVTAADLRVAQGYVRCGRCSSVFNALARLTEERGGASLGRRLRQSRPLERAALPRAAGGARDAQPRRRRPARPPSGTRSPPQEESPPTRRSSSIPATTDVNSVFVQPPPDPQWTAATGSFKALIAANDEPVPKSRSRTAQVDVEIDAAFFASMLRAESPPKVRAHARARAASPRPPTRRGGATGHDRAHARSAGTRARGCPPRQPRSRRHRVPVFDRADADGDGLIAQGGVLRGGPGRAGTRGRGRSDADAQQLGRARAPARARLVTGRAASRCCCSARRW